MPAFFSSLRTHEIHHLKNLLESAGIRCQLRNEGLSTLAGEVPFVECAVQLWLEDDADRALAEAVLREMTSLPGQTPAPWACTFCGETLERQFTACWRCGSERG